MSLNFSIVPAYLVFGMLFHSSGALDYHMENAWLESNPDLAVVSLGQGTFPTLSSPLEETQIHIFNNSLLS